MSESHQSVSLTIACMRPHKLYSRHPSSAFCCPICKAQWLLYVPFFWNLLWFDELCLIPKSCFWRPKSKVVELYLTNSLLSLPPLLLRVPLFCFFCVCFYFKSVHLCTHHLLKLRGLWTLPTIVLHCFDFSVFIFFFWNCVIILYWSYNYNVEFLTLSKNVYITWQY